MSFDRHDTKLAYDGWSSPTEFINKLKDWMSMVGTKMDNEARVLAILKQSLKPSSRARTLFELRQTSLAPFTTFQEAENELVGKFYTTEMKTSEMNKIMDPSFVQEETEASIILLSASRRRG